MFMLVLATGLVGLLTSTSLLRLHLQIMSVRYLISVTAAYGAFLALVWLWVLFQQRHWKRFTRSGGSPRAVALNMEKASVEEKASMEQKSSGSIDWLDWLDLDELVVVALAVAGAISIVFVIGHLVSMIAFASDFLAEVFLDAVFSAALYHRLRRIEHRHWLKSVFARTRAPFLWTLLFFAFIGVVSQHYAPEAISIGGVVRHISGYIK